MIHFVSTFLTPTGRFSLAVDNTGAVVAAAFGSPARLRRLLRTGALRPDRERTAAARTQVREYFAGRRTAFTMPLAPAGTPFQQRVWAALARIQFGSTRSYAALARELETSPRAVGGANAANPVCLLVPCHRIVGSDGSLTGFAYGKPIKQRLLAHEARLTLRRSTGAGR